MEHLATFTVAKETGIVYPQDGMRRLLQLEKSNGIWSQKMHFRMDQNWVLIMDYETGVSCIYKKEKPTLRLQYPKKKLISCNIFSNFYSGRYGKISSITDPGTDLIHQSGSHGNLQ